MDLFEEFYNATLQIDRLNYAYVVLIPKRERFIKCMSFRPISLLNVIYKIIRKVLTARLNTQLDNLVDNAKTGFIKGRFILDGVVVAQEIISNCFILVWMGAFC